VIYLFVIHSDTNGSEKEASKKSHCITMVCYADVQVCEWDYVEVKIR